MTSIGEKFDALDLVFAIFNQRESNIQDAYKNECYDSGCNDGQLSVKGHEKIVEKGIAMTTLTLDSLTGVCR